MDQNTHYSYEPIQPNQLRLLKFLQDNNHISAILKAFSVEEPLPPFHALSYTWASEDTGLSKSRVIEIENQQIPVLDSLQPFFQVLRAKGQLLDGRWWWIDSICIDQTNLAERGHQVQLMQHIYRRANQVVIWLGEQSSDSELALDFIKLLDRLTQRNCDANEVRSLVENDRFSAQWTALTNFLSRKWWSRIWTIQEFVLPMKASIWCGMRTISRSAVCRSLLAADKCRSVGITETLAFHCGFNRRRLWNLYRAEKKNPGELHSRSLLALAAYLCFMDATDDRDRLYGLMALATDASLMDVNYSLNSAEIYLSFTQDFITRYKSLDIICYASVHRAPSGSVQPSWVPDWRKRKFALVCPFMVSQSSNPRIGNLRPPMHLKYDPSIFYSASQNRAAEYEFRGSALLARGIIVDTIDGIAGSRDSTVIQSSEWKSTCLSTCSASARTTIKDIFTSVCRSLVLDRKDRYLRYPMPTEEFIQDFLCLLSLLVTDSQSSAPKEFQTWFHRTRALQIRGHSFESIFREIHKVDVDYSGSTPNRDEIINDSFFGRFFDTVVKMSLRLMCSCSAAEI
ncbi:hypothetical protein ACMFMG_003275 [Clarireedia jacksonii]